MQVYIMQRKFAIYTILIIQTRPYNGVNSYKESQLVPLDTHADRLAKKAREQQQMQETA